MEVYRKKTSLIIKKGIAQLSQNRLKVIEHLHLHLII